MRSDADFDVIGGAFEADVYGSSKGVVRLHVLRADLVTAVPRFARGVLRILDAGGGSGRLALQLAQWGNDVVLAEPAREMLDQAQAAARATELHERMTFVQAPIQSLGEHLAGRFDVITCHAVLE